VIIKEVVVPKEVKIIEVHYVNATDNTTLKIETKPANQTVIPVVPAKPVHVKKDIPVYNLTKPDEEKTHVTSGVEKDTVWSEHH
jgi:hypothetical protein